MPKISVKSAFLLLRKPNTPFFCVVKIGKSRGWERGGRGGGPAGGCRDELLKRLFRFLFPMS